MRWPWRRGAPRTDLDSGVDSDVDSRSDPGPDADRVVVFVHLPKCGGTSLHDWMVETLPPGVLSPERHRMPAEPSPERIEELQRHRVFSGHFDMVDLTHFPMPQRRFTVLRDPVERLVSLYDFWRAHDPDFIAEHDLAGPRFAASVSFEDFVGAPDPSVVHDIDNTMVRTFTGAIRSGDPIADREASLATAIEVLTGFDHVGHVRRLGDTLAWMRVVFGLPTDPDAVVGRANVRGEWAEPHLRNVERTVVSPAAAEAIEPMIDLDRRLVAAFD